MITIRSIILGDCCHQSGARVFARYHSLCYSSNREKRRWTLIEPVKLAYQCFLLIRNHAMWSVVELSSPRFHVFLTAEHRISVGTSHAPADL